jgi:DNA-directed RNA polymerase subunit RPC12/RpoP
MELTTYVECPHCGYECHEHVEFNTEEGSREGINSGLKEGECAECDKKFWFTAYCELNVEVNDIFSKKPKAKK